MQITRGRLASRSWQFRQSVNLKSLENKRPESPHLKLLRPNGTQEKAKRIENYIYNRLKSKWLNMISQEAQQKIKRIGPWHTTHFCNKIGQYDLHFFCKNKLPWPISYANAGQWDLFLIQKQIIDMSLTLHTTIRQTWAVSHSKTHDKIITHLDTRTHSRLRSISIGM